MPRATSPDIADEPRTRLIERLVDAIDLPIARWDAAHRLTYCNRPYVGWAARPATALLGRTLEELYGSAAWAAAREAFVLGFAGRPANYERPIERRDGPPRWARIKVFPDGPGTGPVDAVYTLAIDVHDDVTERDALRAARRRLDRFTDNIPYPLSYVDRAGVLRFVNRAYVEAAGAVGAALVGAPCGDDERPWIERALGGETVQHTRQLALPQGLRWVRTSYVPDLDGSGRVVGIYATSADVHEMTLAQEQLQRSVERDAVTDVLSRRALIDRIEAALPGARAGTPVALFFVDLDGFKAVNDTHGHRAGDRVLAAVGRALQQAMRADDAVGRFGGDEFIVLARVHDTAGASALAQHLLAAVRGCDGSAGVSASVGFALAPADAAQTFRLVQRADDAMYAAKRRGGDRAVYCGEV